MGIGRFCCVLIAKVTQIQPGWNISAQLYQSFDSKLPLNVCKPAIKSHSNWRSLRAVECRTFVEIAAEFCSVHKLGWESVQTPKCWRVITMQQNKSDCTFSTGGEGPVQLLLEHVLDKGKAKVGGFGNWTPATTKKSFFSVSMFWFDVTAREKSIFEKKKIDVKFAVKSNF